MTIKEASEKTGISIDNLRYYERIGLKMPETYHMKCGISIRHCGYIVIKYTCRKHRYQTTEKRTFRGRQTDISNGG